VAEDRADYPLPVWCDSSRRYRDRIL